MHPLDPILSDRNCTDDFTAARAVLEWKHHVGFRCNRCGHDRYLEVRHRICTWECTNCGYQETARVRTIMQNSGLRITSWLKAIGAWIETGGAISAKELQWRAGLPSYTSAWRIRKLLIARAGQAPQDFLLKS